MIRGALGCIASALVLSAAAAAVAGDVPEVRLGGYRVALAEHWKLVDGGKANPGVVATRSGEMGGSQIGEILAATLKGTIESEIREMVDSANGSKGKIRIVESGDFRTDSGTKGRKLSLRIAASDPSYGSPLVLHSIYLPRATGGSVTFKLRCGESKRAELVEEFEAIVRGAAETPEAR